MKKVQIGVRISEEDAEFLNLLQINGAKTPSDKLRAIIEEARARREYGSDFQATYRLVQEQLGPALETIKRLEFENDCHSAIVSRILEWLPDYYAYCLSALSPDSVERLEDLEKYEKGSLERLMRLVESLLHLELSGHPSSYDQGLLFRHIEKLSRLLQVITESSQSKEAKA